METCSVLYWQCCVVLCWNLNAPVMYDALKVFVGGGGGLGEGRGETGYRIYPLHPDGTIQR